MKNVKQQSVYIIAEAGVNHNGSMDLAKKLIDSASEAGADAVKFQAFKADTLVSVNAKKANYQIAATGKNESQYEMLKKLELDKKAHEALKEYASLKKIDFLSSPFDLISIDELNNLGLETFKIPSGEITNLPYLRKIGSLKKQVILSTGMANLGEIEDALNILELEGTNRENIIVLHCNTEYPTPMQDVNLKAMQVMRDAFNVKVGYSDHTIGIEIPIAAVALGACVIEKHFTLDKTMEGPDHPASLEPDELRKMVMSIRNLEFAMGDGIKRPSQSERKNISVARKSIVASKPIVPGEIFSEKNITVKRPGTGISPMRWDDVIGKAAIKNYVRDELL